jgi:hypothetical protein
LWLPPWRAVAAADALVAPVASGTVAAELNGRNGGRSWKNNAAPLNPRPRRPPGKPAESARHAG